jgi:hypothetical protein
LVEVTDFGIRLARSRCYWEVNVESVVVVDAASIAILVMASADGGGGRRSSVKAGEEVIVGDCGAIISQ